LLFISVKIILSSLPSDGHKGLTFGVNHTTTTPKISQD
jgi:hypothetical protein